MKPFTYSLLVGAAVLAMTITASGSASVADHEGRGPRPCRNRSLRGDYGLLASGSRVIPFGPDAGKTELVIGTGLRTYDGEGGFTDSGSDLHGQLTGVTPDPGGIVGTYEVNPDCTGTSTRIVPGVPFPIVSNFVIVAGGATVKEAVMQPTPNVITVVLEHR